LQSGVVRHGALTPDDRRNGVELTLSESEAQILQPTPPLWIDEYPVALALVESSVGLLTQLRCQVLELAKVSDRDVPFVPAILSVGFPFVVASTKACVGQPQSFAP
jgi:hypothetical protein